MDGALNSLFGIRSLMFGRNSICQRRNQIPYYQLKINSPDIRHRTSNIANHEKRQLKQIVTTMFIAMCFYVLCGSCTQSDLCLQPQSLALRGGFYYNDTSNTHRDTLLQNANLRFGTSYSYFTNVKKQSKFSFSLSQIADTIPVIFQSDSTTMAANTIDTLQLIYTRELHFISVACGYQTYFTLQKAITTNHIIDSVLIAVPQITNETNKEHLKLVIKK